MALLDLQALEITEDEAFGDVETGSSLSLLSCGHHSNLSLLAC
ncbi:SapB/AmfS family lanthipeptide [Streptomyces qinzhouensis]|nr:SapB/AmfS family lanthipeptide [Streptomyces qinzhouensis]